MDSRVPLPVLTSETKFKEVMSLSDLTQDELREHLHDEAWGDDNVWSHYAGSLEPEGSPSVELSLGGQLHD